MPLKNRTFKVEKLAHGGMGIVRDASHAVFVPFVIPGEEVKIRVEAGSKKPVRAALVEVVSPSPDRVVPACPLFGECGGCQFQHISYPAQLKYKAEILAESLAWIAKIKHTIEPFAPSPRQYHYRSRIRMHVRRGKAGFFAREKKKLVPVKYCFISHESINRAIPYLEPLIGAGDSEAVELINENETIAAVVESRGGATVYRMVEKGRVQAYEWAPAPDLKTAFQQVNPEQNHALRSIISANVADIRPEGVLELYAGAGNLTEVLLPLSRWVVSVEAEGAAVELAREKLGNLDEQRLKFLHEKADAALDQAFEEGLKPDLVLLDPPRTGAKESLPGIMRLRPGHIIYVSCDPATLARDLKSMLLEGYQLKSIVPLDMFPQTSHIEAIAVLTKHL